MDAEIIIQVLGNEVVDERPDGRAAVYLQRSVRVLDLLAVGVGLVFLPHIGGTQLGLGLALEVRLLDLDADGTDYALAAVLRLVVLLEIILERLGDGLAEGGQVGTSVPRILSVDERRYVLSVGIAVGNHDFDVLVLKVDRLIQRSFRHILADEVEETVLRLVCSSVEYQRKSLLEVGIVLDHRFHDVHVELVCSEHLGVRSEYHEGTVLFRNLLLLAAVLQFTSLVGGPGTLTVPERLHVEPFRKGVHRLRSDSVQTD